MAFQEFQQNTSHQTLLLTRYLQQKQQSHLLEHLLIKRQKYLNTLLHEEVYVDFKLELEKSLLVLNTKNRLKFNNLQTVTDRFEYYYQIEKLRLVLKIYSHKNLAQSTPIVIDDEASFLEKIKQKQDEHLLFKCYYLAISVLKHMNLSDYKLYEYHLFLHQDELPKETFKDLFTIALNFCIKQTNLGVAEFKSKALALYQLGFKKEIFIQNGFLHHITYRNAIGLALQCHNYEWTQFIINTYTSLLQREQRADNKNYCELLLNYHLKDYKKVIQLGSNLDFQDELLALNTKSILLKVYYEKQEYDLLEYHLESFKAYIQRKKIQGFYKDYFLSLVKLTKRLITASKPHQLLKIEQELKASKSIASKEWLLEKVERLLNT